MVPATKHCFGNTVLKHCPETAESAKLRHLVRNGRATRQQRVSENNPGSGIGTWVLVSVPPLTLNLSQWFLLPCTHEFIQSMKWVEHHHISQFVYKYLAGHLLKIQISVLLPWRLVLQWGLGIYILTDDPGKPPERQVYETLNHTIIEISPRSAETS